MSFASRRQAATKIAVLLLAFGLIWSGNGITAPQPVETQKFTELYKQAVASPIRTDEDRNADEKRKPLEFLQFTGVRPGMLALDVAAGGGYTTQLLALAVGSSGTVWAQTSMPRPALGKRLTDHPPAEYSHICAAF